MPNRVEGSYLPSLWKRQVWIDQQGKTLKCLRKLLKWTRRGKPRFKEWKKSSRNRMPLMCSLASYETSTQESIRTEDSTSQYTCYSTIYWMWVPINYSSFPNTRGETMLNSRKIFPTPNVIWTLHLFWNLILKKIVFSNSWYYFRTIWIDKAAKR